VEVERGKVEEGIGEDGREEERGTYDGEGAWIGRRTAVVDMVATDRSGGFQAKGGIQMSRHVVRPVGWDEMGKGMLCVTRPVGRWPGVGQSR
jgi:hypothetical protein